MSIKTGPNPKLFRELSVPFKDLDAANAALDAFYEDLLALRIKHKIPTLLILTHVGYEDKDQEITASSSLRVGDQGTHLQMLAEAYGEYKAQYDAAINAAANGKRK